MALIYDGFATPFFLLIFVQPTNTYCMMPHAYLLLGGNQGVVPAAFRVALQQLSDNGVQVKRLSPLYRTEPWGMPGADDFYNQAVEVETKLQPHQLLHVILSVESAAGRKRRPGVIDSRPLDIDILLYDDLVLDAPELQIPHPRMHERRFVLAPLADIAPALRHPGRGETISDLLEACEDPLLVERVADRGKEQE